MAAKTLVASACTSGVQPRYNETGTTTVYSEYTITATLSTGDVIRICKIPDNSRIVDIAVMIPNALHVNAKVSFGTADDHDLFIASATISAARIFNFLGSGAVGGFANKPDTSDDATTRYTEIRATVSDADSTTGSTAGTLKFLVSYTSANPY